MAFCVKCKSNEIYNCIFCDDIHFFCSKCHPDKDLILQTCYSCELKFCKRHTLICYKSRSSECYNYNPREYFLCPYCFNELYKVCDNNKCPTYCSACFKYLKFFPDHNICTICEFTLLEL